jgi:hypothetical protein
MNSLVQVLEAFPLPPGADSPRFHVNQAVRSCEVCNDRLDKERYGLNIYHYGYITGAVWNPSHWNYETWVYWVFVVDSTYSGEAGETLEFPEDELEVWS